MDIFAVVLAGVALAVILAIVVRCWRRARWVAHYTQAKAEFPVQSGLSETFLAAANKTGKPRGLRWKSCELHGASLFTSNHATGEIFALSGATIGFVAIPGGDMEDVEAVGDIRYVTAIFVYRDGKWESDGRAIFNLEPAQALERFSSQT